MGNNTQLAINTRIGPREIDPDRIIHFPCGLVGLESEREFALLQIHQDWPLLILQSATTPAVGLMVADPYSFLDSYPIQVGEAELALLGLESKEEASVLVTVSRPADQPGTVKLNLCGPSASMPGSGWACRFRSPWTFPAYPAFSGPAPKRRTENRAASDQERGRRILRGKKIGFFPLSHKGLASLDGLSCEARGRLLASAFVPPGGTLRGGFFPGHTRLLFFYFSSKIG